jgi:hypothetical protein
MRRVLGCCCFDCKRKLVRTHPRYIGEQGGREVVLGADKQSLDWLERIRRTSKKRREGTGSELFEVHKLFREFAITRITHRAGGLSLVDIEARFAKGEGLRASMIDLVFLLRDQRLLFIEAKCVGNPAVRSTKVAEVERRQVPDYERHIRRGGVLDALNRSLQVQSELVSRGLGQAIGIACWVPVLILDPLRRGLAANSKDTWLTEKLGIARNQDWSFAPGEVNVIDGMHDPAAAVREFVQKLLVRLSA